MVAVGVAVWVEVSVAGVVGVVVAVSVAVWVVVAVAVAGAVGVGVAVVVGVVVTVAGAGVVWAVVVVGVGVWVGIIRKGPITWQRATHTIAASSTPRRSLAVVVSLRWGVSARAAARKSYFTSQPLGSGARGRFVRRGNAACAPSSLPTVTANDEKDRLSRP